MTREVLWQAFLPDLFLGRLRWVPWLLLALPGASPEPWFEVVIGGGEESHDGDTQETPLTTPASLLAETSL